MKRIIEAQNGSTINLHEYELFAPVISKVWTIYDEEEMWNYCQFNPDNGLKVSRNNLETLKPFHRHGVFKEMNSWNIDYKNNLLYYNSRLAKKDQIVKILIEYEEMLCQNCSNWAPTCFDEHFCIISGNNKIGTDSCTSSEKNVFKYGNVYGKGANNETN